MNERPEIDGEACEGERKVERRQCGAISAEKMGQPLFRICIRGVGHRFAANLKASPLSSLLSENGPMDVRAVCHFVPAAMVSRTDPLKAHTPIFRLLRKIREHTARAICRKYVDYTRCDALNYDCIFFPFFNKKAYNYT